MSTTSKQISPIINLSVKMNARQNNETLDSDANQTGLELVYAQNGDPFYTQSYTTRQGVTDIGGGVIGASGSQTIINYSNLPSGAFGIDYEIVSNTTLPFLDDGFNHAGMIFIPSGNVNILDGSFQAAVSVGTNPYQGVIDPENFYNFTFTTSLFQLDQIASGQSYMIGANTSPIGSGIVHNIAYSGNFNSGIVHPLIVNPFPTSGTNLLATASSEVINFGNVFVPFSGLYFTPTQTIECTFGAPVQLYSGNVYYFQIEPHLTSGTGIIDFAINYFKSNIENGINTLGAYDNGFFGEEHGYGINPISNIVNPLAPKPQTMMEINSYISPSYMIAEQPLASYDLAAPLISGTDSNGFQSPAFYYRTPFGQSVFNGNNSIPPINTETVEFGQVFNLSSGLNTINGAYFYVTPNARPEFLAFTSGSTILSGTTNGYNLGYICNLSEILASTGTFASGNYTILNRNIIATYSGNYVFGTTVNNYQQTIDNETDSALTPSYGLNKLISIFDSPPIINNVSGTPFLLSFNFYDFDSGNPYTDYSYYQISGTNNLDFQSFAMVGYNHNANTSGTYVVNWSGDGISFSQPSSGSPIYNPPQNSNLACGIICIPSGQGITSIYDYRSGVNRSQAVIYTQGTNLGFFDLANPTQQTVIFSGAIANNNYLWNHSTFQNLLFSHQYSQTSGVCWDQIYFNPSGNSTQLHGLQPVFSGTGAQITLPSGANPIPSGSNFNIIASTQILSGGLRSSSIFNVSGTTNSNSISGTQNAFQIFGVESNTNNATYPYDIYHVSGVANASGTAQYNFDVFSNGTYIWATQSTQASGGSVFYLANLCDASGTLIQNPLPNVNTWNSVTPHFSGNASGVYIFDISFSGTNTLQVPNILTQYQDQTYITNQIPTPKFKKTIVWNNILWGIGDPDNTSRLWYTNFNEPQVWGINTNYYDYYDIDPDNGQELTGIEIYKGQLIFFKERSTYSATYTGIVGDPISYVQISSDKGCIGIFTTASTDYGIFCIGTAGFYLATQSSVESISDDITPFFNTLDKSSLIYSTAVLDLNSQQVMWSISNNTSSPDFQTAIMYSYAEESWHVRQNGVWLSANTVGDINNFPLLIAGTALGQIQQLNSGVRTQDVIFTDESGNQLIQPIVLQLETPWMNFSNSQDLKQMQSLRINSSQSNQILRIDVYFDQNMTAPKYTRYIGMNGLVINRVASLAQNCRTVKLIITSMGLADEVQLNSLQFSFIDRGQSINI